MKKRFTLKEENFGKVTQKFCQLLSKKLQELNVIKIWKSNHENLKLQTAGREANYFKDTLDWIKIL